MKTTLAGVAVRIGLITALFAAASISAQAADATDPPEIPGPAERGINPDTTLITIKDMLVNQRMDAMFEVPLIRPFKVADHLSLELSTHYNSNILSWLDANGTIAYIPSYRNPLGVGFEMPGYGSIFQNHQGLPGAYTRDWVVKTPDGNIHSLYPVTGNSDSPASGGFTYGNTFLTNYGTPNVWRELYHNGGNLNTFEYHTVDHSLLRARLTIDASGLPASWEVLYPDGNKIIYDRHYAPAARTADDLYFNPGCCVPASRPCPIHIDQADPQDIVGFYPGKVSNRMNVGFTITYQAAPYDYLISTISDDTDRNNGDIIFSLDPGHPGHYLSISYPAASGSRVSVSFDYTSKDLRLRKRDGTVMFNMDGGAGSTTPEPLKTVTLLQAIHWPNGYTQSFDYHDENSSGLNNLAGARIKSIVMPAGAIHEFSYKLFPFQETSYTPIGTRANVGVETHVFKTFANSVPGESDFMLWTYSQRPVNASTNDYDVLNTVKDPSGNDTVYKFFNNPSTSVNAGLLQGVTMYEGGYAAGTLKESVNKYWAYHENTQTDTLFNDDLKTDNTPNKLIVQNEGSDRWGHFTTVTTSGSVVPVARRVVTTYAVNRSTLTAQQDGSLGPGFTATRKWTESCTAAPVGYAPLGPSIVNAYYTVANCGYLASLLDNWFPSEPAIVETQELIGGLWTKRSRTETQFDQLNGEPVRSIKRYDPLAAADNLCTMNLTPRVTTGTDGITHRDEVTDFFYDSRGNLALKVNSGGEDNPTFRSYMGSGTPPSTSQAPSVTPAFGLPGSGEAIYPNTGSYFGFNRWTREFSPGETADHQYLDMSIGASSVDIDPASGAVLKSAESNGLATTQQYDDSGRRVRQQFQGDGVSPDQPVLLKYINVGGRQVGTQTLQFLVGDETQTSLTQDYTDAMGRKIISVRRNPAGGFGFQATHYDEAGHMDYLSNWSFVVPPGIGSFDCTSSQFADPVTPCPMVDPAQWTSVNLLTYITTTVGSYTRNCYRVSPNGTNNYRCNDTADYEFKGRVRRVERRGVNEGLLSAVDTVYFGLNNRVITHRRRDGAGDPSDKITINYMDGFGNLRIVDEDAGAAATQQGADAIYDYDYNNILVKANLVPQVTFPNPRNLGNYLATSNGDHQARVFTFDPLGRKTSALQPESGLVKFLKYNALGKIVEVEDENGRIGGGPGGGVFSETQAAQPNCEFVDPGYDCDAPNVVINGVFVINGEINAQWNGRGARNNNVLVPGSALYYKVTLNSVNGTVLANWTLGLQSLRMTGISSTASSLWVQVSYSAAPSGSSANQTFPNNGNPDAYRLIHAYDSRGRETAVQKKKVSDSTLTTLRQFFYETQGENCAPRRSCGKLTQSTAMRANTQNVTASYDFLNFSNAVQRHDGRLARQFLSARSYITSLPFETRFDYDSFGRLTRAYYPTKIGPASPDSVQLDFQFGGVKALNRNIVAPATVSPYATMGGFRDYLPDNSLHHFLQGNGVNFVRTIDEAERVSAISYATGCLPEFTDPHHPCSGATFFPWQSGGYVYDGQGGITDIGADHYTYDRLNRLLSATQNRHPRALDALNVQPDGAVNLTYSYDAFGNIRQRTESNPAGNPYTAKLDPTGVIDFKELFSNRDYTNGVLAPDNKIHDTGFLYDANGNLVTDGKKDYIYDELNQQYEVREPTTTCFGAVAGNSNPHANRGQIQNAAPQSGLMPASVACYGRGILIESNGYDANGLRASRDIQIAGGSTATRHGIYIRTGDSVIKELTEENIANGDCTTVPQTSHEASYIYGPVGLLATESLCTCNCQNGDVINLPGQPTTRYYETDHLTTIRAITDSAGILETTFDYEPFGLELNSNDNSNNWWTDASSHTHRFTGHEREFDGAEFPFADYMKARMFALNTARFDQTDPVFAGPQDAQNWCAQSYVRNMPVNWWDPDGKVFRSCVIATPACQPAIDNARACVEQAFDRCIDRKGWTPLFRGGGDSDQPITRYACAAEAKEKCQAEIDYATNFCNFVKETCGLTAGGK